MMTTISYPALHFVSPLFPQSFPNLSGQEAIWREMCLSAAYSVSMRPVEALLAMWETRPALPKVDSVDNFLHTFHRKIWRWLALAASLGYTAINGAKAGASYTSPGIAHCA